MSADLLLELGTEELPARHLESLGAGLDAALCAAIQGARLDAAGHEYFATSRRLAVRVSKLAETSPGSEKVRRGPALEVAFDASGRPTPAALGFARSCGVGLESMERGETHLLHRMRNAPRATVELLPELVRAALAGLPSMRRMRWKEGVEDFVRPVRWVVLLYGTEVVELELFGLRAGRSSRGHRLLAPAVVELRGASEYEKSLEKVKVLASPLTREIEILNGLNQEAHKLGAHLIEPEGLLAKVSAMVEWPQVVVGSFPEVFLELPCEVLIAVLGGRQFFFPLEANGRLTPHFLAVMDQEPEDPGLIRAGYERVLLPRFKDAQFFLERDRRRPLAARCTELADIVFHHRLGSMLDKSERVAALSAQLAGASNEMRQPAKVAFWDAPLAESREKGVDPALARRAGELCKCDLTTELVGEFPELQGFAGRYYAECDGESKEVAAALEQQYLPRHAGDNLPSPGKLGEVLALADRLDTLSGFFGIGEAPTGDKDPYGLRRAALGCVRILSFNSWLLDLEEALAMAARGYGRDEAAPGLLDFMLGRWRAHLLEVQQAGPEEIEAVLAVRRSGSIADLEDRLLSLRPFQGGSKCQELASVDKRIRNILRKSGGPPPGALDKSLLREKEELDLAECCRELRENLKPHLRDRQYETVLEELSTLHSPVENFFDKVLVQCEDEALRRNRLALLAELHELLRSVADLSLLPTTRAAP